jgi:hypothetical protein
MEQQKLKVAWFSPLYGASVSAYVTRILLPILKDSLDISVFSQEAAEWNGFRADNYLNAAKRDTIEKFDIFFYNLEDLSDLNFSRIHLALKPGVVWFHDFFMTSYGPEPILNSSWSETVTHYKDFSRAWPGREQEFKPTATVAQRESALSILPIFSNPRDLAEHKRLVKGGLASEEIMPVLLPHPVSENLFNIKPTKRDKFTIGLSIKPRVEEHAHHLFSALKRIDFGGKLLWPIKQSERVSAQELLNEFDFESQCEFIDNNGPSSWESVVEQIDLAVHLRFSSFGQPSPCLPISLAAAVPALVTDFAAGAVYPDCAVFKIKPGRYEEPEIALTIQTLQNTDITQYAKSSRSYATEFHNPRAIANELVQLLVREAVKITNYSDTWNQLEAIAHKEVIKESLEPVKNRFYGEDIKSCYIKLITEQYKELGWI